MVLLATLACSFNVDLPNIRANATTIPVETFTVDVPAPQGNETAKLVIAMGAGELTITPNSTALVSGTIRYNLQDWKPVVSQSGSSTTIEQENIETLNLSTDIINEWMLALNPAVRYNLDMKAGAYQGNLDLSGLSIERLQISDGASQSDVTFNSPNPVSMASFAYKTGASQVHLNGLSNANFREMTFECGAGDYTLDFGGPLQQDASVKITGGVSQIVIIVPEGTHTRVETSGALNNVDTVGDWSSTGQVYETEGSGSTLSIEVEMGVGNLILRSE